MRRRQRRGAEVRLVVAIATVWLSSVAAAGAGAIAGKPGRDDLVVTRDGAALASVVVSAGAGPNERRAADDLVTYIERMSGARPALLREPDEVAAALAGPGGVIVVGEKAFELEPDLRRQVASAAKPNPTLRSDSILLRRSGRRVYVVGNSDLAHYFAAVTLLRDWGARWYMPGEFGECIPAEPDLSVGELDLAYGSPFEIRSYWISWLGDDTGREDFQRRNMMTGPGGRPPANHSLGQYTVGLGAGPLSFPITARSTAEHVARGVAGQFGRGADFSLAMEDGLYDPQDPRDRALLRLQWDKYMLEWSVTDAMLELYGNVVGILRSTYPGSPSKIGFLAYSNMTLPPVRPTTMDPALYADLAPIDIDPIHGMRDPRSPARAEYGAMMRRWAEVMQGRLTIYDYDQGMLVWRDLPNPSHMAFRQDVQEYRRAGILGVDTESRNALATTFINLYLRAELLWNPDQDLDAVLEEFFVKFYGPAAAPMGRYWRAIFQAWSDTIATEHEYFVIPAIYTTAVVEALRREIDAAEAIVGPLREKAGPTRDERLLLERMRFSRLGFDLIDSYTGMAAASARESDFAAAIAAGERGLAARAALTKMNGTFTSTRMESGPAFWPGEVDHYRELLALTDGARGRLVARLPLDWALRRDPGFKGEELGFPTEPIDLGHWRTEGVGLGAWDRKDYPDRWEMIRTDLYAQAQGVLHPDGQGFRGALWYRTEIDLTAEQANRPLHVMFPGVFGVCRLFLGREEIARREQDGLWWRNDYRFEWDVDLSGEAKAGKTDMTIACRTDGHLGGLFRRPFLYTPVDRAGP